MINTKNNEDHTPYNQLKTIKNLNEMSIKKIPTLNTSNQNKNWHKKNYYVRSKQLKINIKIYAQRGMNFYVLTIENNVKIVF